MVTDRKWQTHLLSYPQSRDDIASKNHKYYFPPIFYTDMLYWKIKILFDVGCNPTYRNILTFSHCFENIKRK